MKREFASKKILSTNKNARLSNLPRVDGGGNSTKHNWICSLWHLPMTFTFKIDLGDLDLWPLFLTATLTLCLWPCACDLDLDNLYHWPLFQIMALILVTLTYDLQTSPFTLTLVTLIFDPTWGQGQPLWQNQGPRSNSLAMRAQTDRRTDTQTDTYTGQMILHLLLTLEVIMGISWNWTFSRFSFGISWIFLEVSQCNLDAHCFLLWK